MADSIGQRKKLGELLRSFHKTERLARQVAGSGQKRSTSSALCTERLAPLVMYLRRSPLVFSLEPGAVGVTEVRLDARVYGELHLGNHLLTLVPARNSSAGSSSSPDYCGLASGKSVPGAARPRLRHSPGAQGARQEPGRGVGSAWLPESRQVAAPALSGRNS